MRKKSIFKKLLFKLTKGFVFSVTEKLSKQVDGCPMGGPISVVFSDIVMCKMEFDVAVPAKPIFHKRYVNDTYVRRKKNDVDKLFEELSSYNENIKLTLEVNPTKFLDTELVRANGEIITQVFSKSTKLHVHWSSKIPVRYKRNAITREVHRAKRIASDFNKKLKRIRQKYRNARFPLKFINETIYNFERGKEEMIIPEWLFDERKTFSVRFPYSPPSEKFSKVFMRIVECFTIDKVKLIIIWNTRKIQSLFSNKDKVKHHSCVMYCGICSCGANYIGETIRNEMK